MSAGFGKISDGRGLEPVIAARALRATGDYGKNFAAKTPRNAKRPREAKTFRCEPLHALIR